MPDIGIMEEEQDLYLRDFYSLQGTINRSNFRALSVLGIGMLIVIYFLPGVLLGGADYVLTTNDGESVLSVEMIQLIAPFVHTVGYTLLGLVYLNISQKRMRDTGRSLLWLFFPLYNLKVLFFDLTKNK